MFHKDRRAEMTRLIVDFYDIFWKCRKTTDDSWSERNFMRLHLCCKEWFEEFYVHVTVHRNNFFLIKPTDALIFPNLFLSKNSTCFGQFLCPSSWIFHCTFGTGICHANLMTARSWCSILVIKLAWHIPVPNVQWKTPEDGLRNCPKHVEFLN